MMDNHSFLKMCNYGGAFVLIKKGVIHKGLIIILSLIFVVSITGCGGSKDNASNGVDRSDLSDGVQPDVIDKVNESIDSEESNFSDSSVDYDELVDAGLSPLSIGLTKFMDVKSKSYEMLTPMMDKIGETNPFAGLAFLPLLGSDLTILPLTMLSALPSKGDHLWEGNLLFMFEGTGRVEVKGDIASFRMEINSQNDTGKMLVSGEYDIKSDSMRAVFTMEDGSETIFEYSASGDGYVSQLYTEDGNDSIIKNAFDERRLLASVSEVNGKPGSIYQKNTSDWESFTVSENLMIYLEENNGYAIIDGEKYEY